MNAVEAMQALVDGKKVRKPAWRWGVYIRLVDGDIRQFGPRHPDVGVAISPLWDGSFELCEEPNPHTKGSFPWAFEEAKRGKRVRRPGFDNGRGIGRYEFVNMSNCEPNVLALDWEVVP